ncbi:MAG: hypothetical protein KAJ19_02400, partial [Gammaproteobacteria bacterium]|nr:hypothetical protein [Gammaproteobacteria bacterium]
MAQREHISGNINNADGIGIAGVIVQLFNADTGALLETEHSIENGYWQFLRPGTGKYNVLFSGRNTTDEDDLYGIEIVDMTEFQASEQFLNDTPPSGIFSAGAAPVTHVTNRLEAVATIQWVYTPDATNKHHGFVVRWEHGPSSGQTISATSPSRKIDSTARDFAIQIPADDYITIKVYAYFNGVSGTNEDSGYQHANWIDSQPTAIATISGWESQPNALQKDDVEINSAGYIILGDQVGNDVLRSDSTHATYRQWIGHLTDPTLAGYAVEKDGTLHATGADIDGAITATSGAIIGTLTVGTDTNKITIIGTASEATTAIYAGAGNYGNADTGFYSDASGRFSMGAGLTWSGSVLTAAGMTLDPIEGIYAGSGATRVQMKPGAGFWAGATAQGSAPFSVTAAGAITVNTGDVLDLLYVGATSSRIKIDGSTKTLGMEDFISGSVGWQIDGDGNAEIHDLLANNITARGDISANSLTFLENAAVRGTLNVVKSAGDLFEDATATGTTFIIKTSKRYTGDAAPFESGDRCKIAAAANVTWFTVGAPVDNTTNWGYTATHQSGSTTATYTAGTGIADFGASGDGGIQLTAVDGNPPSMSIFTHAGSPWSATTQHVRIGNLNGNYGYVSDVYGFAAGDAAAENVTIDATNGVRFREGTTVLAELTGSTFTVKSSDSGQRIEIDGSANTLIFYDSVGEIIRLDDSVFGSIPGIELSQTSILYLHDNARIIATSGNINEVAAFRFNYGPSVDLDSYGMLGTSNGALDSFDRRRIGARGQSQINNIASIANSYGVSGWGNQHGLGDSYGVHGEGITSSSGTAYGIYALGTSTSSGDAYGLYATATSTSGAAYAGYFAAGDVYIADNLGVGILSPETVFHVSSATNFVGLFESSDAIAGIEIRDTSDSLYVFNSGTTYQIGSTPSVSTNNLTILSDGKVGMNDTTPSHRLTIQAGNAGLETVMAINADDGGRMFSFGKDASDNANLEINDTSQNVDIRLDTAGNSWLNGGNVGINDASP